MTYGLHLATPEWVNFGVRTEWDDSSKPSGFLESCFESRIAGLRSDFSPITEHHLIMQIPRFAVSQLCTFRLNTRDACNLLLEHQINAIGLWRTRFPRKSTRRLARFLKRCELTPASLCWVGGFTGGDALPVEFAVEEAAEAIRQAAELGVRRLIVNTGGRNGHTLKHARELVVAALHSLLPLAEQCHVTLALQPLPSPLARKWSLLSNLPEALHFVQLMDHPRLKLALDTYYWGLDPAMLDLAEELAPLTALIQMADSQGAPQVDEARLPLGQGEVPWSELIAAYASQGFTGWWELKVFGSAHPPSTYAVNLARSAAYFHQVYAHVKAGSTGTPVRRNEFPAE